MFHFYRNFLAQGALVLLLIILGTARKVPAPAALVATEALASGEAGLQSQQGPVINPPMPEPSPDSETSSPLSHKQRRDLLKSNFEKMKHDADELSTLVKSLQDDLSKSNQNVLSLKIADRAEKIERLAKKIKTEVKGY